MSYTLRGRIESRLAGLAPVVVAACVLTAVADRWWPVQAVALMAGVGVALDVQVYHRLLRYQPAWAAVPLGALELGVLLGLMRLLGVMAPLSQALALFGVGCCCSRSFSARPGFSGCYGSATPRTGASWEGWVASPRSPSRSR